MSDGRGVRSGSRMRIDREPVHGQAGTSADVDPATEEKLGELAGASKGDMHRAID